MTEEKYIEMKKEFFDHIKEVIISRGGLSPQITVIGKDKEEQKNSLVQLLIDPTFMENETAKDKFMNKVLPDVIKEVNKRFTVDAVAWAAEAYMRITDDKKDLENWKALPIKKEVLFITIESESRLDNCIMEIVRHGKQVTSDGDLVDNIDLIEMPEMADTPLSVDGRFSGLYKKFTANLS